LFVDRLPRCSLPFLIHHCFYPNTWYFSYNVYKKINLLRLWLLLIEIISVMTTNRLLSMISILIVLYDRMHSTTMRHELGRKFSPQNPWQVVGHWGTTRIDLRDGSVGSLARPKPTAEVVQVRRAVYGVRN
jgi:hypothetical protein